MTALLLAVGVAQAQTPTNIISVTLPGYEGVEFLVCPPGQQNFAGTVSLGAISAQSNDIDLDTMFLCFGDEVQIVHNGDANLTGDPNPLTPAGIAYSLYECPPIVMGPDKDNIGTDPCLVTDPPPADLFWVATEGNLNGDILFFNDHNFIDVFNAGLPGLFWWAPITFDALSEPLPGLFQAVYENNGPCVHVNTAAAIPVVYLREITATEINTNTGFAGCQGSFRVRGGLPQFNNSLYDISITLDGDPGVEGIVANATPNHNDVIQFTVPVAGVYNIVIEDGKSCGASFQMDMSACTGITVEIPNVIAAPGSVVCLPVTVFDFNDILALQFPIIYDESIVTFSNVQNFNPAANGLNAGSFNDLGGALLLSWNDPLFSGITLPDGAVLFEVCFNVIGVAGETSPVEIGDSPIPPEAANNIGEVGFNGINGSIFIGNNVLGTSYDITNVSCPGQMDGEFTITVNGGLSPYELSWSPLAGGPVQGPGIILNQGGTFTASNLNPGSYAVTVTDDSPTPLEVIDTITIAPAPELNVIFTLSPPPCNGGVGSVTAVIVLDSIIIANPGPEYTYAWSNMGTTQTINGVPSGLYSVEVTNQNTGCSTMGSTFLPQTPLININVTNVTDVTCSGFDDGSITVEITGGTPAASGYTIFWPTINGGTTVQALTSTVNNLFDGDYEVIVTDDNGCTNSTTITVGAVKQLLIATTTQTDVSCNGDCDGVISISASTVGGVSNTYQYSWFGVPAPPAPTNTATTSTLNGLCPGNYSIVLTDDQGCQTSEDISITEPPVLNVSLLSSSNESCSVGNDGSAVVQVSGGVFPYTYDWGLPNQTDSVALNLSSGVYQITATDANGCVDSLSVTISTPTPPVILSLNDDVLDCFENTDGSLTVAAMSSGSPIVDYAWSTMQSGVNLTSISGLGVGTYFVTVTAADDCFVVDSAVVTAPEPLTLTDLQLTPPLCAGEGGGSISVLVNGGTGPYFFDWSPLSQFSGVGNFTIGGAPVVGGMYSVTVTDANDCQPLVVDIDLPDPPSIVVQVSAIDSVSCFNSQGVPCDGTATATASYSDGSAGTFNFIWSSGENFLNVNNSTAVQLCQGGQNVLVSDGTCFTEATLNIPVPPALTEGLNSEVERVSCFGDSDGSIFVDVTGGTGTYNFNWSNGATTQTVTNLAPGPYTAVITDSKGCQFQFAATVGQPAPLVAFVDVANSATSVTCFGDTDGILTIGANGGNLDISSQLTFTWPNNVAPPGSATASNLPAGTYDVIVTDFKGCTATVSASITEPDPIIFSLGDTEPIRCNGLQTNITVDTAYGGNGQSALFFSFSVDNTAAQPLGTPIPVFGGSHLISIFDGSGCAFDTTIFLSEPLPIILEYPEEVTVQLGDSVVLQPTFLQSVFPIKEDSIFWTPTTSLTFGFDSLAPTVTPFDSQLYQVTAYDENDCEVRAEIFVEVEKRRNVYLPNVFSPNGDGFNDFFQIFTGAGVNRIRSMRVFDRWGELVYQRVDLPAPPSEADGWDGTFRGKIMPSGVYVYIIEVEFLDNLTLLYRGDVTLLR